MTWEILAALITITGMLVTLGGVLSRLTRTLSKLECAIDSLGDAIDEIKGKSAKTHERIFAKLDAHDKALSEHNVRIHDLEHTKEVA